MTTYKPALKESGFSHVSREETMNPAERTEKTKKGKHCSGSQGQVSSGVRCSNCRKGDCDWERHRQGQGGSRGRVGGQGQRLRVSKKEGSRRKEKALRPAPTSGPWPLLALSCVWPVHGLRSEKSGNHWFKEQPRRTLSRTLLL